MTQAEFEQENVRGNKAVVIQNLFGDSFGGGANWTNRSAFQARYGHLIHEVRWPIGSRQVGILSRKSSVKDYMMHMNSSTSSMGMMFSSGTPLWNTPSLFSGATNKRWKLDAPIFSLAATRVGLPFHNHGSAWEQVVVGKKLFLLMPPLGGPIPPKSLTIVEQAAIFVGSSYDFLTKHYDRLAPMLQPRGCLLEPGDAIYIPCNHYHLTMNVGDTVAVGGILDAASAAADVCPRDISALASSFVAPALPALLAPTSGGGVDDGGPANGKAKVKRKAKKKAKNKNKKEKATDNQQKTKVVDAVSLEKRLSELRIATQLTPFSLEAIVKYGVLLASTRDVLVAVKWFEASGKRFAALGEAGILPATPLSVVLELFADYCYGLVATLYRGADAYRAKVSGSGSGSGGENKHHWQHGYDVAINLLKQAKALDSLNPKVQTALKRMLRLVSVGNGHGEAGHCGEEDGDTDTEREGDGCDDISVDGVKVDLSLSTFSSLFWYQFKGDV